MENEPTKPWYASTTVWASILQVVAGLSVAVGLFDAAAGTTITSEGPAIIVSLVTAALGAWGVYGRVKATTPISPNISGVDPNAPKK